MWPFRLFRSKAPRAEAPSAPATAAGERIYVFGDVHGRHDLLGRTLAAIDRDLEETPPAGRATIVGLGDYVDRGPDSSRVVLALIERGAGPAGLVSLRGNHEEVLLQFLDEPVRNGERWFAIGGSATVKSYGVPLPGGGMWDFPALRQALVTRMPPAHLMFLQALPTTYVSGDYLFVHAGVRLGRPLAEQEPADLLWIRRGFSDGDAPFEKVVVHGHTPVEEPFFGTYRINLDTGAYFSGRLTCLVLEGDRRRLLQV